MTAAATDPVEREDDAYWNSCLDGAPLPLIVGVAETGYYRLRMRNGPDEPIKIFRNLDGIKMAQIGERRAFVIKDEAEFCERTFAYCAERAIEPETYSHWMELLSWPDDAPPPAVPPSNLPSDPFEAIKVQIEAECEGLETALATGPIKTAEYATKLANWMIRIEDLGKQADAMRIAEKRPHDEASRAVQDKFRPMLEAASTAKRSILGALAEWEHSQPPKPAQSIPLPSGGERKPSRGIKTVGRTITVPKRWKARIDDYGAALTVLGNTDLVRAAVQAAADREARSREKRPIRGVTYIED